MKRSNRRINKEIKKQVAPFRTYIPSDSQENILKKKIAKESFWNKHRAKILMGGAAGLTLAGLYHIKNKQMKLTKEENEKLKEQLEGMKAIVEKKDEGLREIQGMKDLLKREIESRDEENKRTRNMLKMLLFKQLQEEEGEEK